MLRKLKKDGLAWYEFSLFDRCPELAHGVFTRAGGVSGPEGQDLNLAFNELDPPENVMINLRRAEAALGLSPAAFARQTHGLNILVVRPGDGYRPAAPAEVRQDYDAVIAPEPGVSLLVKLADCQGIMLYDQTRRMLGLVHSGWRGSARNIIGAAAAKMKELGARTENMLAAVTPSLGPCCAEFRNYEKELPRRFQRFMVSENHFDFWAISVEQLVEAGLKAENIEVAGLCTKCSAEFFSYRRGDVWGRFGILAGVLNS